MPWDKQFNIGISEIDSHHETLISLFDELNTAMHAGIRRDELRKILSRLSSYTKYHFRAEEQLMASCAYPEFERHQKLHHLFEAKIAEFEHEFERGESTISFEMFDFLKTWIMDHIQNMDKKIGAHVAKPR